MKNKLDTIFIIIIFLTVNHLCYSQSVITNKINKVENQNIYQHIDKQTTNNYISNQYDGKDQNVYLLDAYYFEKDSSSILHKLIFGNPDNARMMNVEVTINLKVPFDTVYIHIVNDSIDRKQDFNVFKRIDRTRDYSQYFSKDKKTISFKALLLQSCTKVEVYFKIKNDHGIRFSISGIHKQFP